MSRVPTEPQAEVLRMLAPGHMLISGLHGRPMRQCLAHGWIAPRKPGDDNGFRITAAGYRALADALDRYGLPPMKHTAEAERREPRLRAELRAARDEARAERDEARRSERAAQVTIGRVRRELERAADDAGWDG